MARTTAPLFSMDASGTVAGAIVFSRWRGRNYVRRHAIPSNPRSGLQVGVRSAFKFLSQWWASFSPVEQALWETVGSITRVTGLNAFIAENVRRLRQGRPFQYDPTDETVLACDALATLVPTALSRAILLEWTYAAPSNAPWGTFIFMQAGSGPPPSIAYLINATPTTSMQLVVTGLTPGISYVFLGTTFGYENYISTSSISVFETPLA